MSEADLILGLAVAAGAAFGFTNGFNDTGKLVAASISTRAVAPRIAIPMAAALNFAGAFLGLAVAATVAEEIVEALAITPTVVFAGVVGAIAWNLLTWLLRVPSSSSHALIGGVVGATLFASGADAIDADGLLGKVLAPALVAPLLAFLLGGLAIVVCYRAFGRRRPGPVTRGFRRAQVVSGGVLALAHGANDAQKTMGAIALALLADGSLAAGDLEIPFWVVVLAASAIALGTYAGGRRVVRGTGMQIIRMDAAQGFSAQAASAAVILAASFSGYPISTTQAIDGGVTGAGAGKRLSAARWGVAGNVLTAWLVTFPAAAALGGAIYVVSDLLGGALGPLVVLAAGLAALGAVLARRARDRPAADPA